MIYGWDERKPRSNRIKHGLSFDAVYEFDWRDVLVDFDDEHSDEEDRWIALGMIGPVLYSLVYTERPDGLRVISLRKSTRAEIRRYADRA